MKNPILFIFKKAPTQLSQHWKTSLFTILNPRLISYLNPISCQKSGYHPNAVYHQAFTLIRNSFLGVHFSKRSVKAAFFYYSKCRMLSSCCPLLKKVLDNSKVKAHPLTELCNKSAITVTHITVKPRHKRNSRNRTLCIEHPIAKAFPSRLQPGAGQHSGSPGYM